MIRSLVAVLPLLLLAVACHKAPADPAIKAADDAPHIPCALAGATAFAADCTIEKFATPSSLALVIHHPDGGFRRLEVTTDGRGVITADGSDQAIVSIVDPAVIEVTVGKDRYHLPATVKAQPLSAR